jgi:hypothetical protein
MRKSPGGKAPGAAKDARTCDGCLLCTGAGSWRPGDAKKVDARRRAWPRFLPGRS